MEPPPAGRTADVAFRVTIQATTNPTFPAPVHDITVRAAITVDGTMPFNLTVWHATDSSVLVTWNTRAVFPEPAHPVEFTVWANEWNFSPTATRVGGGCTSLGCPLATNAPCVWHVVLDEHKGYPDSYAEQCGGLTPQTTYVFVLAVRYAVSSNPDASYLPIAPVTANTVCRPQNIPAITQWSDVTDTMVTLEWSAPGTAVSAGDSWRVQARKVTTAGAGVPFRCGSDIITSGTRTHTCQFLESLGLYQFRVLYCAASFVGRCCESTWTVPIRTLISNPAGLICSNVASSSLNLRFQSNFHGDGLDGVDYTVLSCDKDDFVGGLCNEIVERATILGTSTPYVAPVVNLRPDSAYHFAVVACPVDSSNIPPCVITGWTEQCRTLPACFLGSVHRRNVHVSAHSSVVNADSMSACVQELPTPLVVNDKLWFKFRKFVQHHSHSDDTGSFGLHLEYSYDEKKDETEELVYAFDFDIEFICVFEYEPYKTQISEDGYKEPRPFHADKQMPVSEHRFYPFNDFSWRTETYQGLNVRVFETEAEFGPLIPIFTRPLGEEDDDEAWVSPFASHEPRFPFSARGNSTVELQGGSGSKDHLHRRHVAKVRLRLVEDLVSLPGLQLNPNFANVEVEIDGYPYKTRHGTAVGLQARVKSSATLRSRTHNLDTGVATPWKDNSDQVEASGLWRWNPKADVITLSDKRHKKVSVDSTFIERTATGDDYDVYFSFLTLRRLRHIGWTQEAGVTHKHIKFGRNWTLFAVGAGGGAMLAMCGMAVFRRWRQFDNDSLEDIFSDGRGMSVPQRNRAARLGRDAIAGGIWARSSARDGFSRVAEAAEYAN